MLTQCPCLSTDSANDSIKVIAHDANRAIGIWNVLRAYGIFPISFESGTPAKLLIAEGKIAGGASAVRDICGQGGNAIWIHPDEDSLAEFDICASKIGREEILKPSRNVYARQITPASTRKFGARRMEEGLVFTGRGLTPLLVNGKGECEAAVICCERGRLFIIGASIIDEVIKFRQGDERISSPAVPYDVQKCTCERTWHRYTTVIDKKRSALPEADIWGWLLVNWVWHLMPDPKVMIWPLPDAKRIVSLLTADGDEASKGQFLKMKAVIEEQNVPVCYFMTPKSGSDVPWQPRELGKDRNFALHPVVYCNDAAQYETELREQMKWFLEKFNYIPSAVRNHMFFHRNHLDLEEVWEERGYDINFNIPAWAEIDKKLRVALLNGSFHALKYRRKDGSWMRHMGILTAYDDGVLSEYGFLFAKRWAKYLISLLRDFFPGVIVANFHPYNIERNHRQIQYYINELRRAGALFMDSNEWLRFIAARNKVSVSLGEDGLHIHAPKAIGGLSLLISRDLVKKVDTTRFAVKKDADSMNFFFENCATVVAKDILEGHIMVCDMKR